MGFKNHFSEQYPYSRHIPLLLCSFPLFHLCGSFGSTACLGKCLFLTEAAPPVSLLGQSYCVSVLAVSWHWGS